MNLAQLLIPFLIGLAGFTWGNALMLLVGVGLIYLGTRFKHDPLLLPLGFGCLLSNLGMGPQGGILRPAFDLLITTGLLPILMLIVLGARLDFKRLLGVPKSFWISLAAQAGIFIALLLALLWKLSIPEAAGFAAIGTLNVPVAIFLAARSAPRLLPAIALVVILLGLAASPLRTFLMRLFVPAAEWMDATELEQKSLPNRSVLFFPISLTIVLGILFPAGIPLIGALLFGNFLTTSGVGEKLFGSARDRIYSLGLFILGLFLGLSLNAGVILNLDLLKILLLGVIMLILNIIFGITIGRALRGNQKMDLRLGLPGSGAEGLLVSCLAGGILLVISSLASK